MTKYPASLILLGLTLILACDSTTETGAPAAVVRVASDSAGPIFRYLDVWLADDAALEVTYATSGRPALQVIADSTADHHRIFLPRLAARRTYEVEVRSVNRRGERSEPMQTAVITGALPPDLEALQFTAQGEPTLPLTMIELMITTTGYNGAFIVDGDGEIVWYWRTRGWINGVSRRTNGNFVLLDADSGLVELTPDARIVGRLPNGNDRPYGLIHHDATSTQGNTVYFLARDTKVNRDTTVVGEAIWEWIPESGQVVKRWSAFDHFDWARDRGPQTAANNWMHANSIMIGPRGNIIVSARNLDEVFSIAPDFGSVEWRLGGRNPTLQLPQADHFYSQHSAAEIAPNHILLFDNGLGRGPGHEWTRVSEVLVDVNTKTATLIWEYRPQPDIQALRVGSVRRLANGNTVAGFGWGQGYPIAVHEVTPSGQVVWSITAKQPEFNRVYRMTPLANIGGEIEKLSSSFRKPAPSSPGREH